jgi:hypothetical protein
MRNLRTKSVKIVPLAVPQGVPQGVPADDAALAAEGKVRLLTKRLPASLWKTSGPRVATDRALEILREDRDAR